MGSPSGPGAGPKNPNQSEIRPTQLCHSVSGRLSVGPASPEADRRRKSRSPVSRPRANHLGCRFDQHPEPLLGAKPSDSADDHLGWFRKHSPQLVAAARIGTCKSGRCVWHCESPQSRWRGRPPGGLFPIGLWRRKLPDPSTENVAVYRFKQTTRRLSPVHRGKRRWRECPAGGRQGVPAGSICIRGNRARRRRSIAARP